MNLDQAVKLAHIDRTRNEDAILPEAARVMADAIDRVDRLMHHWRNVGWMDRDLILRALRPPE